MTLTAQDLYNYTKCAHRVYLDAHGDPTEKSEVSSFVKLLWEMGLQKELEHLGTLVGTPIEDLKPLSIEAAAKQTAKLLREGAPLIYQGVIRHDELLGRPDLLVRRDDAPSAFGAWHYEAIDIKAGRGWEMREGSKPKFKRHYALQVMFYRDILTRLQQYAPPQGKILNIDGEIESFDGADFESDYASALAEVQKLVAGRERSEPVLSSGCSQCEWYRRCRQWVETTHDPSGLFLSASKVRAQGARPRHHRRDRRHGRFPSPQGPGQDPRHGGEIVAACQTPRAGDAARRARCSPWVQFSRRRGGDLFRHRGRPHPGAGLFFRAGPAQPARA